MCTVKNAPLLKDLFENITPFYAAEWYEIGVLLGLPCYELRAIKTGNPTDPKKCCNCMLETWLELDHDASWKKIFDAIESPAVYGSYPSNGKII